MYTTLTALDDCYGCGVCSAVCPVSIISMELDPDGFLRPVVREGDKCIRCGLCDGSCAYLGDGIAGAPTPQAFSARSTDEGILSSCSSGGAAYELALGTIAGGGKVCGVRYDAARHKAAHYVASAADELPPMQGSKYLQSDSSAAFREILRGSSGRMITGTPCQIASLRKYLRLRNREDDFLLVDLFCHGVPSQLLWHKYREMNAAVFDAADKVIFRDKSYGWHASLAVSAFRGGEKTYSSRFVGGDLFYRFYLGNSVLALPCCTCPFRLEHSAADIRLGDMWGSKYADDRLGVSALVVFSDRGMEAVESLKNVTLLQESLADATAGQMSGDLKVRPSRRKILNALRGRIPLKKIYGFYILPRRLSRAPVRLVKRWLRK